MIAPYYQTKTPISFWCRRGLNPRSFIQPSETLSVELTGTHKTNYNFKNMNSCEIKCAFGFNLKSQFILLFTLFLLLFIASLHFLVLFMGLTVLFQLTFNFIYSIFNKNFQFQQNKQISNRP